MVHSPVPGTSEIRNAGLGADAGAREEHDPLRAVEHAPQPVEVVSVPVHLTRNGNSVVQLRDRREHGVGLLVRHHVRGLADHRQLRAGDAVDEMLRVARRNQLVRLTPDDLRSRANPVQALRQTRDQESETESCLAVPMRRALPTRKSVRNSGSLKSPPADSSAVYLAGS